MIQQKNIEFVRIGTSGIVVPGNKATFPPEYQTGSRLRYYGSLFNTLEINNSFYKIPMPATFERWATEVPDYFKFTVKLWKGITHAKQLAYAVEDIDIFMRAANVVGDKKGCLLLQFPASITYEYTHHLQSILERLCQHNQQEKQWQLAIELRHPGWHRAETYDMLNHYRTSLVIHDMPASKTPADYPVGDCAYLRFHGPAGDYRGSYSDEFINKCASRIKKLLRERKEIYVYFNNTMEGALDNAQALQRLLNMPVSAQKLDA